MLAAYVTRLGTPDEIRVGELPEPRPGPGEVLVDVTASSVNAVDTFVRSGSFRTEMAFPFVVGRDLVGTVADPGDSGFRHGDRVWCNSLGHDGRQGAVAERAAVPAERLYRLPDGVDPDRAVTVLHPGATAHLALVAHGGLRAGDDVLVIGAAGHVGSAATVLATRAGARVLAVARADDDAYCRGLGADAVVDRFGPDPAERVRELAPDGVRLCVDTSGRNDLATWIGRLAVRGRFVMLAGREARPTLTAGELYTMDRTVTGFVISRATPDELADAARSLNPLLAEGALRPRRTVRTPLSRTAEAHRLVEAGAPRGTRVVLEVRGDRR